MRTFRDWPRPSRRWDFGGTDPATDLSRIPFMLSPSQNAFIRWAWQGGTFECEGCGGTVSSGETPATPGPASDLSGQRQMVDVVALGGGLPIMMGDEKIGGFALSGATTQEDDEKCARVGLAAVGTPKCCQRFRRTRAPVSGPRGLEFFSLR